jgi:hypothetical protein
MPAPVMLQWIAPVMLQWMPAHTALYPQLLLVWLLQLQLRLELGWWPRAGPMIGALQ